MAIINRRSASLKRAAPSPSRDPETNADAGPDCDHIIVIRDNTKPSTVPVHTDTITESPSREESGSAPPVLQPNVSADSLSSSANEISKITTTSTGGSGLSYSHSPIHRHGTGSINWKKDSLRKHLAERKYRHNWKTSDLSLDGSENGTTDTDGSRPLTPTRADAASTLAASTLAGTTLAGGVGTAGPSNHHHGRRVSVHTIGSLGSSPHTHDNRVGFAELKKRKAGIKSKKHELKKRGHRALQRAKETGRRYKKQEFSMAEEGEIDVLYENQRGWYFFGIPLFSSRSLLPTDSPAWTNKFHTASPVTTVDAQLPDPSWQWAWRSWFVDMTGDVDEEGWQYSFAFRGTRWHGVAVWWHSFVRRRRWVRKRVKKQLITLDDGTVTAANTSEYFTIHSRKGSTAPEVGGSFEYPVSPKKRTSSVKFKKEKSDVSDSDDEKFEDITNIPALLKAFKKARLDREKLDAVEEFIHSGGQEVIYLADSMSTIMSSMIFQTSRRRLLAHLIQIGVEAEERRKNKEKDDPSYSNEVEKIYISGLNKAIDAAEKEVRRLEYWSDVKRAEKEGYAGVTNSEAEWEADGGCVGHEQEVLATPAGDTLVTGNKITLEDVGEQTSRSPPPKLEKGKGRAT